MHKLALLSKSHPISLPSEADEENIADERRIWEEDGLFERIFEGLLAFLEPKRPPDALEQALVLLWELVQLQWVMFEDHDIPLCDALFRLRASTSGIVLESTNSLISLLTEVSDPLFFLGVLHGALSRYLVLYPPGETEVLAASTTSTNGDATTGRVMDGEAARASGYLFGLNAIGMCILKLPKEVVEVEGRRLAGIVMNAMTSPTTTTRQAANTLILAVQCVLADTRATLALFTDLNQGQKDLAIYLMERNGLIERQDDGDLREKVKGEMVGLMARGISSDHAAGTRTDEAR